MPACPICAKNITAKHIGRHVRATHGDATSVILNNLENSARWRSCDQCGLLCVGLAGLNRHCRTHGNDQAGDGAEEADDAEAADEIDDAAVPLAAERRGIFAEFMVMDAAIAVEEEHLFDDHGYNFEPWAPDGAVEDILGVEVNEIVAENNGLDRDAEVHPLDLISLTSLVTLFRRGLYTTHESWLAPLQHITRDLLEVAAAPEELHTAEAIAALQLLPGLVEYCRSSRGDVLSPIQFLRVVENSQDRTGEILRWARLWSQSLQIRAPSEWGRANAEQIRQRIEVLIGQGRLSAAATMTTVLENLLNGIEPPAPMSAVLMAARIDALHPPDDHRDILPPAMDDPALGLTMQLSPDSIRNRMYRLKKDSSAGNSGWTNRVLRFICEDRDNSVGVGNPVNGVAPPNALHIAFTALCNKILRGELSGIARELLTTARLIMIPKPDGGLRPIRIVCAIQRMFGAAICIEARNVLGTYLRPIQLGGGYKSGAEIAARFMDIAYLQGDAILKLDISNAFNTVRHGLIYDGILTKIPGLARYFRFQYGSPSVMRNNEGEIVARTRTGVGQGDPCAPCYFELGIHPALLLLQEVIKEVEAEYHHRFPDRPVRHPARVVSYEDDTMIRGDPEIIYLIAPRLADHFDHFGFEVKVAKSKITGSNLALANQPVDFTIESNGFIVLGIPIGSPNYCEEMTRDQLLDMAPPISALRLLRPRSGFQLVSKCFSGRPAYLLRAISSFSEVAKYAEDFDKSICSAIMMLFQSSLTDTIRTRIYLPRQQGGLGLLRHHGMITEKNQIISRLLFLEFLHSYHPNDIAFTQDIYNMRAIHMGDCEDIRDLTEITEEDMASMTHQTAGAVLKAGKEKAAQAVARSLLSELADRISTRQEAAWFLSSTSGSAAFLDSPVGISGEKFFSSEDFRCAARAKLGMGPSNDPSHMIKVCACRRAYVSGEEPFHGISCFLNRGLRTRCHTEMVNLLFTLLKKRFPGGIIGKEQLVGETLPLNGVAAGVYADIVARVGAVNYYIDVSTVDPGCRKAMGGAPSSVTTSDAAAKAREATKRVHYNGVATPARLSAESVIPFVIETTGRLGPAALSFLFSICGTHTLLRSQFLNSVVLLLNRFNGAMLRATRDRFVLYPQNGGAANPMPA